MELQYLVIILVGLIIGGGFFGFLLQKRKLLTMLKDARSESERIVSQGRKEADQLVKSASEESRAKAKQQRRQFEAEAKRKRQDYQKLEQKHRRRESALDEKAENLMLRERDLDKKESGLFFEQKKCQKKMNQLHELIEDNQKILEKTASMSADEAKQVLIASLKDQAKKEASKKLEELEAEVRHQAEDKARHIISLAVQRQASEYVGDATLTVVSLPSEDMKGRIIGREGRNIRAFEQITGVDVIIDDTPEALILSCFHPIRREIAKITLERLMEDGRIHPARIEETAERVTLEFDQLLKDYGEKAALDVGVTDLHPDLLAYLGHLQFRSFGKQSVLAHSVETARITGAIAEEIGLPLRLAKRAGLLHDIGKAVGQEMEGHHGQIGAKLCARYGENKDLIHAIEHHHQDDLREADPLTIALSTANIISESRKGARESNVKRYVQRLEEMEALVKKFEGINKCFVFQAGREIRVMVDPDIIEDDVLGSLSREIASKIKEELTFPGRVKITLVRESKYIDYAK